MQNDMTNTKWPVTFENFYCCHKGGEALREVVDGYRQPREQAHRIQLRLSLHVFETREERRGLMLEILSLMSHELRARSRFTDFRVLNLNRLARSSSGVRICTFGLVKHVNTIVN